MRTQDLSVGWVWLCNASKMAYLRKILVTLYRVLTSQFVFAVW